MTAHNILMASAGLSDNGYVLVAQDPEADASGLSTRGVGTIEIQGDGSILAGMKVYASNVFSATRGILLSINPAGQVLSTHHINNGQSSGAGDYGSLRFSPVMGGFRYVNVGFGTFVKMSPDFSTVTFAKWDGYGSFVTDGTYFYQTSTIDNGVEYVTRLQKFGQDGVQIWSRELNSNANAYLYSPYLATKPVIDTSGNIYYAFYLITSGTAGGITCLCKYNSSGTLQWQSRFNRTGTSYVSATGITIDSSGNIFVSAYGSSTNSFLAKLNSSGTLIWGREYKVGATVQPPSDLKYDAETDSIFAVFGSSTQYLARIAASDGAVQAALGSGSYMFDTVHAMSSEHVYTSGVWDLTTPDDYSNAICKLPKSLAVSKTVTIGGSARSFYALSLTMTDITASITTSPSYSYTVSSVTNGSITGQNWPYTVSKNTFSLTTNTHNF